jgi:hypothetical protein
MQMATINAGTVYQSITSRNAQSFRYGPNLKNIASSWELQSGTGRNLRERTRISRGFASPHGSSGPHVKDLIVHTRNDTVTFIHRRIIRKPMKKQFILGLVGSTLGILTAIFVILSATGSDQTLSGVQAALFSSLGLMGAAIANKETRFAGWMLLLSAVFITLSVPVAGTLNLLFLYMPAVVILGITAILCFMEPEEDKAAPE